MLGFGMVSPNPAFTTMMTTLGLAGLVGEYKTFFATMHICSYLEFCFQ